MDSLQSDQVLSFLQQNPSILTQLLVPQPPTASQQLPLSAAPAQPASQSGIIPQPLPHSPLPPSQPMATIIPSPIAQITIPPAPIRPYSSLNMLANVSARNTSLNSGFPLQTSIGRANQQRLEHAELSGDRSSSSEKKKTKRKAKHAPALDAVTPMIDHTINTAGDGSIVINLEILIRFAMPDHQDLRVSF